MTSDDEIPNKKKPVLPKDDLEVQAMHGALVLQHEKIEALKRQLKSERARGRMLKSQLDFAERLNGMSGFSGQSVAFPAGMLDRLIRLAHPDRHGNSDSATQATAWLLSQRA